MLVNYVFTIKKFLVKDAYSVLWLLCILTMEFLYMINIAAMANI